MWKWQLLVWREKEVEREIERETRGLLAGGVDNLGWFAPSTFLPSVIRQRIHTARSRGALTVPTVIVESVVRLHLSSRLSNSRVPSFVRSGLCTCGAIACIDLC